MTHTFIVHVDLHPSPKGIRAVKPDRLANAIYRAIMHATESDIEGAEALDSRIGQVQVRYNGSAR